MLRAIALSPMTSTRNFNLSTPSFIKAIIVHEYFQTQNKYSCGPSGHPARFIMIYFASRSRNPKRLMLHASGYRLKSYDFNSEF